MKNKNSLITLYIIIIALIALACGFSDVVLSNYFKDAYDVSASQRGFIEFPRELPGILSLLIIASLSKLGDIKITLVAQIFSLVGILILGVTTPSFYTMTALIFVFSMGIHIYLPLQDTLAMSILPKENIGTNLGKIKGVSTFFSLLAATLVFLGFKFEFFSFTTEIKSIFILSAVCFGLATIFLILLSKKANLINREKTSTKIIYKKKYNFYYILAILNGVQKQIVLVYAPWVIIDLLNKGADTMSLLVIISGVCGMFFLPFIGKCLDKFGIRNMLYADALSYIFVYLSFAYMTYNIQFGSFGASNIAILVIFLIFIIDRMSSQMGIIRTIYLKSIIDDDAELLPTMSLGIALDHVVAIFCAYASGLVWELFGAHVIFIIAASFSIFNLIIAKIVPIKENKNEL